MTSIILGAIALDKMAGGLEKNIVLLANHFVRAGAQVSIVTFDTPGATAFYELDPSIKWHKVGRTKPHTSISFLERFKLILRIRSVIKKFDQPIVVCFHHGILPRFCLAGFLIKKRLICSERNSISLYKFIRQSKWSLGFISLALTHRITVQFPSYVNDYPAWLRTRIRVIPNPVYKASTSANPNEPGMNGRFRVLAVGRICAQKNQKALVNAFANLHHEFPEWDLHIIGDGEEIEDLNSLIRNRSLADRVFLWGNQQDVSSWLRSAHLFCMPSSWEGFPNALAEAMAHGLPSIGLTDCAGVRDLIVDGICGSLTTIGALEQSMRELMQSPVTRFEMGRASKKLILRFDPKDTFYQWDELIAEINSSK